MNWLKDFMVGRYGGDQLSMVLLVTSVLIIVIARLAGLPLLVIIGYIPLGVCVFRMLSRDISKRRMENYKFAMLISPVYSWFKKIQNRIQGLNAYRYLYFKCPKCKTNLRLPKNKGKIVITCPKCRVKFARKT